MVDIITHCLCLPVCLSQVSSESKWLQLLAYKLLSDYPTLFYEYCYHQNEGYFPLKLYSKLLESAI